MIKKYCFRTFIMSLLLAVSLTACDDENIVPDNTGGNTEIPDDYEEPAYSEDGDFRSESVSRVDHDVSNPDEWIKEEGELPSFSFTLKVKEQIEGDLRLEILGLEPGSNKIRWSVRKDFINPQAGSSFEGFLTPETLPAPGYYICKVMLNGTEIKSFNVMFDMLHSNAEPDCHPDFLSFWEKALADLAKVPMDAEMVLSKEHSSENYNVYFVKLKSAGDFTGDFVEIRGWYVEPAVGDRFAVQFVCAGYDNPNKPLTVPVSTPGPDKALLVMSPRGQGENCRNGIVNPYGDWFMSKLGYEDEFYYRGAYLDQVRAIEFLASLDKIDKEKIYCTGGSQGGCLAVAAAALCSEKLCFAAADFPFMGNFPLYLKTAGWPNNLVNRVVKNEGISKDHIISSLSYFDTKNLATMIHCPILIQMTLQDAIAPPWTQSPIILNLPENTERQWSMDPDNAHGGGPEMREELNEFIERNLSLPFWKNR